MTSDWVSRWVEQLRRHFYEESRNPTRDEWSDIQRRFECEMEDEQRWEMVKYLFQGALVDDRLNTKKAI